MEEILTGGMEIAKQADVALLGGHTIKDEDLKYGLAITGIVHPEKLITNDKARPGDVLILTKPIGTGVISTALKAGKASAQAIEQINQSMTSLNRAASECMVEVGAHACTDITGFGLLGHAAQMAQASNVSLKINAANVPLFDEAMKYVAAGMIPGGTKKNEKFIRPQVEVAREVDPDLYLLLCDAQTSGGLLIAVTPDDGKKLLQMLHERGVAEARIIGEVVAEREKVIHVVG